MTEKIVEVDPASVPMVCRYLRTRQPPVTILGDKILPWEAGANPAASYWCLTTVGPTGPDDAPVHPVDCREGRACYRERG